MLGAIVLSELKQVWSETHQSLSKRAQMKRIQIMINFSKVCFVTPIHPRLI